MIGQPVGVVNLPDEVCGRELHELVSDGLFSVLRESTETLLDRLCSLFNVQAMLNHLTWNPRHVRRFPSEDVLVCLEEGDGALSYLSSRPIPIRAILVGSNGLSMIFLTS